MKPHLPSANMLRWLPHGVFCIGLAMTIAITNTLWNSAQDRHAERRAQQANEVRSAIEFRMSTYVQSLEAVRSLFRANQEVSNDELDVFVESLGTLEALPGIQAIGWNRLVDADDVADYEASIEAELGLSPDEYEVRPIIDGQDLLIVEHVTSATEVGSIRGFNVLGEERRAVAFGVAGRTNRAVATAPLNLITDDATTPAIVVLLPIRTASGVKGAASGVFRTEELLTEASTDLGISFVIEDVGAVGSPATDPVVLTPSGIEPDRSTQTAVEIYGRRWLVSLAVDQSSGPSLVGPLLGVGTGVALAGALAWLVFVTQRAAAVAQEQTTALNTDLIEANLELQILGTRLEEGIRSADVLVWESNLTTGATWSSADENGEQAGIEDSFFDRLHPEDRARIEASPPPRPGDTRVEEFRIANAHGEYRWVLSRSHGLERDDEHVVIGAHIDITDQRHHTETVERLNEDLTERNRSLSDFSHVASHDLRSPLRAVRSLVGFLREDLPADALDVAEQHLGRIEERVTRMSQLIDDLLGYATAHNRNDHDQSLDVDALVRDAVDTLDVPAGMSIVIDCDVPRVQAARTPLTTCVRNLVDNAIKHHDKAEGRIAITAFIADEMLHVAVTDNGRGIEEEYLPKIFEPFRRLRVDELAPGSGIGLSVIERTAAAHGGQIDVSSTVGAGSTFTLRWPLAPAHAPAVSTPQPTTHRTD